MFLRVRYQAKTSYGLFLGFGVLLFALAMAFLDPGHVAAACSALPTGKGTVTMNLSVPATGSYRVWARILAPSASVNGFYIQIPDANACQITMGNASIPTNTWTWIDYRDGTTANKINVTLTSGTRQVQLAGLDDGVQVDKILLLGDTSCTPAGDGTNCISTASSTPAPPPSSGGSSTTPTPVPASPSQTSTVKQSISIPTSGINNAKCTVDGKSVDCALVDTTKLTDGNHTVTVTGTDASGKPVTKSTTINVKNKQTLPEKMIAVSQKYRWPLLGTTIFLGTPALWLLNRKFSLLARLRHTPAKNFNPPYDRSGTMVSPTANIVHPSNPSPHPQEPWRKD